MISLSSTTDKIQVILDSSINTNQLTCIAIYRDTTTTGITPSRNVTLTNNTTAVDLVGSPSSSTQRLVEYISIQNTDINGNTVTIRFSDNGTYYTLFKSILSPNSKIEYSDKSGFKIITSTGSVRNVIDSQIPQFATPGLNTLSLPYDVTINSSYNLLPQKVDGFGFPTNPGKRYYFRYVLFFDVDATTTGSRWNLNFPIWTTFISLQMLISTSVNGATLSSGLSSSITPSTATATSPSTLGNLTIIEGFIFAENYEFIDLTFSSEVVSPAYLTLKSGSFLIYNEVY